MKTYTKTTVTEAPRLEITHDFDPISPREDTNLGYFITKDTAFHSPDEHEELEAIVKDSGEVSTNQEDHMKMIKADIKNMIGEKVIAIYPVTKYEHSGVSFSLGNQSGFDYSQNGFYIITDKTAKEIGVKKEDFEKIIKSEIDLFNSWVNNEVYGFILYDKDGEQIDSCCGFYDIEDIREHLPKEWKNEDLTEYFKNN